MPREAPVISAVEDNNKKGTWTNRPNDQFFKEYYVGVKVEKNQLK